MLRLAETNSELFVCPDAGTKLEEAEALLKKAMDQNDFDKCEFLSLFVERLKPEVDESRENVKKGMKIMKESIVVMKALKHSHEWGNCKRWKAIHDASMSVLHRHMTIEQEKESARKRKRAIVAVFPPKEGGDSDTDTDSADRADLSSHFESGKPHAQARK